MLCCVDIQHLKIVKLVSTSSIVLLFLSIGKSCALFCLYNRCQYFSKLECVSGNAQAGHYLVYLSGPSISSSYAPALHYITSLVAIYSSETGNICPVTVKIGTDTDKINMEIGSVYVRELVNCFHF